MPEDNQATPSPTQDSIQQNANQVELQRQMEVSLKGFAPDSVIPTAQVDANSQPQNQQPDATKLQSDTPAVVDAPAPEPFSILKEKFGWQSPEDALTEVEALRLFKSTPLTPAEIQFENEDSEKMFKAVVGGKRKELYQALHKIEQIESLTTGEVTKENAPSIIKLGMQLKYPNLTAEEIDYRFNKQFSIPKLQDRDPINETDEEFAQRKSVWQEQVADIEMNKRIEAKLALPELESAKSKIVFPEIDNNVDEGYVQYRKMLEEEPKLNSEIKELYKKITPDNLETKIKFTDEPNKIDFEFQYKPDADSFSKSIDIASNINNLVEHFKKPDGTPDREGFAKAMYFALNASKMLTEAMNQSKNATIKSFLPDNRNGGTQRQFPQAQELSELDKQMKLSLNLNGHAR